MQIPGGAGGGMVMDEIDTCIILSPAGIFRSYIELRETHKSSFFRCSFWKPSGLLPQGGGGVHMEGSAETQ